MTRVKVCGLTSLADARAAAEAGADFLGFIFAAGPRRLDPRAARGFWGQLPGGVPRVAVFRDQALEEVELVVSLLRPDYLQFHGNETPGFCRVFGLPVIRAFSAREPVALSLAEAYADCAAYFLVDMPKGVGLGPLEDAVARAAVHLPRPVFLAGGLDVANVARYVGTYRPFGVDVARGVEASPGVKDQALVREFVRRAKQSDGEGT